MALGRCGVGGSDGPGEALSDETGTEEIAALIGREIGMSELTWWHPPAEESRKYLLE